MLPDDQQAIVELYTNEAVEFSGANKAKPFFLYLPHNAVHFPIYPGKKWVGKSPHGLFSDWVEEMDWSVGQVLDAVDLAKKLFAGIHEPVCCRVHGAIRNGSPMVDAGYGSNAAVA